MILFLYGDDSYRLHTRVQFLKEAFRAKYDKNELSVTSLNGEQFDIDEFRKATKSSGLFSTKRFVVLRNIWKLKKDEQDQLETELDSLNADTILCISAELPQRKNNALFKRLLTANTVEEYPLLNPTQLRAFIRTECKKFDVPIEPRAVEQLAESIGTDLWRLSNEIKKLAHYTTPITASAVSEFVDAALDENIFHLTDALSQRNAKAASRLLQQQYEAGAEAPYLLAMLGRQIGILLKVKKTGGAGLTLHPYVLEKARAQVKHFSEQELSGLFWRLLEIDRDTKTRAVDPRVLLDLFIVEACSAK